MTDLVTCVTFAFSLFPVLFASPSEIKQGLHTRQKTTGLMSRAAHTYTVRTLRDHQDLAQQLCRNLHKAQTRLRDLCRASGEDFPMAQFRVMRAHISSTHIQKWFAAGSLSRTHTQQGSVRCRADHDPGYFICFLPSFVSTRMYLVL